MHGRALHRRLWLFAAAAVVAGCSSSSKSAKKKRSGLSDLPRGPKGMKRPKGPKTMGNMLLKSYMADLETGTEAQKATAARELANMGSKAKAALPLLEPLAGHSSPDLSAAAKQAIKSIKK